MEIEKSLDYELSPVSDTAFVFAAGSLESRMQRSDLKKF